MSETVIQNWTSSDVLLNGGRHYEVKYRVYRDGARLYQEICESGGAPIHTRSNCPRA